MQLSTSTVDRRQSWCSDMYACSAISCRYPCLMFCYLSCSASVEYGHACDDNHIYAQLWSVSVSCCTALNGSHCGEHRPRCRPAAQRAHVVHTSCTYVCSTCYMPHLSPHFGSKRLPHAVGALCSKDVRQSKCQQNCCTSAYKVCLQVCVHTSDPSIQHDAVMIYIYIYIHMHVCIRCMCTYACCIAPPSGSIYTWHSLKYHPAGVAGVDSMITFMICRKM